MLVEPLSRKNWRTPPELAEEIFEYIEVYYNRSGRHSALNSKSHAAFEAHGHNQRKSA